MGLLPPNDKNREVLHCGTQLLDGLAIFQGQRFALAFFLGTPAAAVRALVKARNERGISAVLLDALLDLLIESGNQRGHQHDDVHAEDHARSEEHTSELQSL